MPKGGRPSRKSRAGGWADPKGLLEGTGKGIRHIKIIRVEDVGEEMVGPP
jgi:hypothetical protein